MQTNESRPVAPKYPDKVFRLCMSWAVVFLSLGVLFAHCITTHMAAKADKAKQEFSYLQHHSFPKGQRNVRGHLYLKKDGKMLISLCSPPDRLIWWEVYLELPPGTKLAAGSAEELTVKVKGR